MAVLLDILQGACDAWLGCGLPAPADAVRAAAWAPDAPGAWCLRCGSSRCGGRAAGGGDAAPGGGRPASATCDGAPAPVDRVIRLGAHGGALRDWVLAIKHQRWEAMAEALGSALGRQLAACGPPAGGEGTVVVPVPMPAMRRWARGIDHAALLARQVARTNGLRMVQPLRQLHAGSQVEADGRLARLSRGERFRWRAGTRAASAVRGRHVVVVDDVRTTGATLVEVARLLRGGGASAVDAAVVSVRE